MDTSEKLQFQKHENYTLFSQININLELAFGMNQGHTSYLSCVILACDNMELTADCLDSIYVELNPHLITYWIVNNTNCGNLCNCKTNGNAHKWESVD